MSLVLRKDKGQALSFQELDGNFEYLEAAMLGLETLEDPAADKLLGWDNTANVLAWQSLGTGLSLASNTLNLDDTLQALAGLDATAGLLCQTGADAFARRTLIAGDGVSILNPSGSAGNPTLSVDTVWGDARYAPLAGATFTGQVNVNHNLLVNRPSANALLLIDAGTGYFPQLTFRINGVNQGLIYAGSGSIIYRNSLDTGYTYFQFYDSTTTTWKTHLRLVSKGGVELYYDGAKKAEMLTDGFSAINRLSARSDGTGNVGILELLDTGSNHYWQWLMRGTDHATEADDLALSYYNGSTAVDWLNLDVSAAMIVANRHFRVKLDTASDSLQTLWSLNGSYTGAILKTMAERAKNSAFSHIQCLSAYSSDLVFQVRGDGQVTADGSFTGGGADRAEMFEWEDGNPDAEDRAGRSVVITGDKIRLAKPGDIPDGVISANPDSVGNAEPMEWHGKYERDALGRKVLGKDGNPVLSAAYDSKRAYIPRAERPEWAPVAIVGRVRVWKGEPLNPRWRVLREEKETVEVLVR